jgi:methyltransferase (TIGR00027 family)
MPAAPIQNVADTAFLVAHHRAIESARPDRLFADPLAATLAGDHGRDIVAGTRTAAVTGWMVAMRTHVIDAQVMACIAEGIDTVLNLGAGLDTRPYRLALPPGLRWIEVDQPEVIAFKTARLAGHTPVCRLEHVSLDLTDGPARRAWLTETLASAHKTLVLTEGVVVYLDQADVATLAQDLAAQPSVVRWIVEHISADALKWRERKGVDKQMVNAPFRFKPDDWFGFFAAQGWTPREQRYLGEVGRRLGRPMPLPWPMRAVVWLLCQFAPPERRGGIDRAMAYVVLERAPPV